MKGGEMSKRKVLICGATGFIGCNLARKLSRRDDLDVYGGHFKSSALDIDKVTPVFADLTNADSVDQVVAGMDVIIQAAATTSGAKDIIERPFIHVSDNAVMNSVILQSAYRHNVSQFVFFSCSVMYQSGDLPVKENDFDPGADLHQSYFGVGWTKIYIEKMCEFYSRLGRTKHTVLRNSNIYGPYDKYDLDRSHVFGATLTKIMGSTDGKISVWGEGLAQRDLLYVEDLVDLVERSIDQQQSSFELVNAGYGSAISVRDLVAKIILASGKDIMIEHDLSKPSIDTRLCLDNSRAEATFDWKPRTNLDHGIKKTLDWYLQEDPVGVLKANETK